MRLVQIVGARPQFIKLAPVSRALARHPEAAELIVHTGQHYDPQLSQVFFDSLALPPPAVNLDVGSGTHAQQTAAMLVGIEAYLLAERPDAVVVYGDTNSTLAGALAAAKLHIPVAHVEAGLRSFNCRMPEELNRVATDHLANLLLAPTDAAMQNLTAEGLAARAEQVGDVMYDALLSSIAVARDCSGVLEQLQLGSRPYGLVTVHRADSTSAERLPAVLAVLERIAAAVPLVFPVHPRTRAALRSYAPQWRAPQGVRLLEPLGPLDMLRLAEAAAVVITDSGGLQKEAFMLGAPCVTLRAETEWTETLTAGANCLVDYEVSAALAAVQRALAEAPPVRLARARRAAALYGDGRAAERCAQKILALAGHEHGAGATAAP